MPCIITWWNQLQVCHEVAEYETHEKADAALAVLLETYPKNRYRLCVIERIAGANAPQSTTRIDLPNERGHMSHIDLEQRLPKNVPDFPINGFQIVPDGDGLVLLLEATGTQLATVRIGNGVAGALADALHRATRR